MQMTNEEIVREYNAAASKSKQIKILADLNCVTSGEIKAILAQAGVDGVKMPERTRQRKPVQTPETGPGRPEVYVQVEAILAALPEDASEAVRRSAGDLLSGMFEDYLTVRLRLGGAGTCRGKNCFARCGDLQSKPAPLLVWAVGMSITVLSVVAPSSGRLLMRSNGRQERTRGMCPIRTHPQRRRFRYCRKTDGTACASVRARW